MIKIVTAYWMGVNGYPFQGANDSRKARYLGSLKSHCENLGHEIIVYTHKKSLPELEKLKYDYNLTNLTIKMLELTDMKLHEKINSVRERNFDINLDGRGGEIMLGKFDVLEKELNDCDQIFWIDVGLQNRDIFPWRFSTLYYDKDKFHKHTYVDSSFRIPWLDDPMSEFGFNRIFNEDLINKIIKITKDKILLITSYGRQLNYDVFHEKGVIDYSPATIFPIGGLFGGDVNHMKDFIDNFWIMANKILDYEIQTTEEAIMKLVFDKMDKNVFLTFLFLTHQWGLSIDFHFDDWKSDSDGPKPLYTVWQDILNYE